MCQFVSWIKKGDKVYFLTARQIFETTRGKQLQKWCSNPDDYVGHEAIRFYYRIAEGAGDDGECSDFSTPDNFPSEIVKAIKEGKLRGLGQTPEGLLAPPAYKDYLAKKDQLHKDYQTNADQLHKDYQAKVDPLFEDYLAKKDQLHKDCQAKVDPLFEDYLAKVGQLRKDYLAKADQLYWDLFAIPENRNHKWG